MLLDYSGETIMCDLTSWNLAASSTEKIRKSYWKFEFERRRRGVKLCLIELKIKNFQNFQNKTVRYENFTKIK